MGKMIGADSVKELIHESKEELINNISDKMTSFVRENYISKAEYETRLKVDMVAMLSEILVEMQFKSKGNNSHEHMGYIKARNDFSNIIQEKIDELKAESEK